MGREDGGFTTSYNTPDGSKHSLTTFDPKVESRTHAVSPDGTVTTTTRYNKEAQAGQRSILLGEVRTDVPWDVMLQRAQAFHDQALGITGDVPEAQGLLAAAEQQSPTEQEAARSLVDSVVFFLSQLRQSGIDLNEILSSPEMTDALIKKISEGLQVDEYIAEYKARFGTKKATDGSNGEVVTPSQESEKLQYSDEVVSDASNVDSTVYKRTYTDGKVVYIKQAKDASKEENIQNEAVVLRKLDGLAGFPQLVEEKPEGFADGLYAFAMTEVPGQSLEAVMPQLTQEQKKELFLTIALRIEDMANHGVTHNDLFNADNIHVLLDEDGKIAVSFIDFSRAKIIDNPIELSNALRDPMYGDVTNVNWALSKALGGASYLVNQLDSDTPQQVIDKLRQQINKQ